MDLTPILVVRDVRASARWYREVVSLRGAHGGDEFEMLVDEDGALQLLLHHREFEEHPGLTDPAAGTPGRGVLLYVSVADAEACYRRAVDVGAETVDEPHLNPIAHAIEFTLKDPDGYAVTVSERQGDV